MACNLVQHGIDLTRYFSNSLPNHPNYHLGPLAGSPCDTLGMGLLEHPPPLSLSVYPNPNSGIFTLSYAPQPTVGELEVRDLSGRLVLRERLPQWSQMHRVELLNAAAGIYNCILHMGARSVSTRIILEP